ncbi:MULTISPECIES: hypothetical protein [unclassified Leisingera]|uniref:hypothetical protein n=1 Tax=unclassified Leisingera TaxID=2614906 RepID=UPI00031DAD10|nr:MULTISPECIES: hypothetical protein [unclassified Leisingera]KIC24930.1 hypothetical protein RA23_10445 [Leisingera sp. ANG-S3]KIC55213.1 hypothetical protein RA22_00160 [Leisingera sp. ANG-S]KID08945.1 hypothetical protein GC1_09545 [Leisingera sp. ANG1]
MYDHAPIPVREGEQIVHAVHARIAPTLTEVVIIVLCAPVALVIWLFVHRAFRSATYVITTQRVLVVERRGACSEVAIKDIQRLRTFRGAMMIHAAETRLWLPRLPDGWQFETILNRVRQL